MVAPKSDSEKYCVECGAVIRKAAEICPKCGVRQTLPSAMSTGHSRIAAALFALLLGGLGVHKFYLGKVGQGLLYLLFFWTFIPAFIAFIEGILYLTMSDAEFTARFG
jgi:TM2 domain-containing membrane protein YozV/ribosomal protein L40E